MADKIHNIESVAQSKSKHNALHEIAEALRDDKIAILDGWEKRMGREAEKASKLISRSRRAFYNSITDFLSYLVENLKNRNAPIEEISESHGINRWEYGYDLKEIVKEWATLQDILVKHINDYYDDLAINFSSISEANNIVLQCIHKGISASVVQYYEMQKREAAAQIEDLKQTLEKSNKDITSSLDLRGTSHDLKGAILVLNSGFDLLKDESLGDRAQKIVERLSAATETVNTLLQDLLDLLRLEAGQERLRITEFNISELIESLGESMRPLAVNEDLALKTKGYETFNVKSDRNKLGRIIQNLVLNALKYTQSGFVKIEWDTTSESHWVLRVIDTGPGLSGTHAASITNSANSRTEPQQTITAKSPDVQSQGEGIGLLVVNQLCKLLDAVIEIETEKDAGTTYEITFSRDSTE